MKFHLLMLFLLFGICTYAQTAYTIYDEIPGINKSNKPAYQEDFPDWAKMLYTESINFDEINEAFFRWEASGTEEHRPIRRYYKQWAKCIQPYVIQDGIIEIPELKKYYSDLQKTQKSKKSTMQTRTSADWTFVGPKETFWLNEAGSATPPLAAPWQVNIYSFDVAETNNDILYCGTETGYINKSIDKGNTWTQSGLDYNFGGGITAVAIDSENEDVVFVSGGNNVHKTIDGGHSWSPMLSVDNQFQADRIEIDNTNSKKIFAAGNAGIHFSEDGGSSWTQQYDQPCYDVHRHPENQNIVYGLSKNSGNFRMLISEDGGESFGIDSNFPLNIADASGGLIAVSKASPNTVFVIMLSSNNTPLIYKGDVITGEWNLLISGMTTSFGLNNGQGYYDLVFEVSDQDEDIIYAGTSSLYISRNGGTNFTLIGGYGGLFPIHPDLQDMKIMEDGEVWVSTDGGMNYSSDNFTAVVNHKAKINGIVGSDMWGFDQGWNEDLVVGGRYHNGNTSMADFYGEKALRMGGAESPTGWILKGRSRHVAFNDLGAGWILPTTAEGKPEGRFLFSKYPNMEEYGGRRGNIATHPNYFGTLILGEGNALWKSEDAGMSYTMIYDFGLQVRYLEVSYANPSVMYVDVVNIGLLKSEDGGSTWQNKPSLTNAPNGNPNWGGRLFFCVSPTDENTIYACLQNGTWSSDLGRIFKSTNGGDSWEDWSGSLSEYTKNLVVQSDEMGEDIVYLFTNARNKKAKVFVRNTDSTDWEEFNNGFPAGFQVNLALPFFRDSKLRVAGNSGVWESPLYDQNFPPILNPWVEKPLYGCIYDTVYLEDHSIIDHNDCTWRWEISPQPLFISDANLRNPTVVLGQEGSFDVTMYVTKNGVEYSKYISEFVSATSCPSVEDCNNPDQLPKDIWELVYVDSEEPNAPGLARMAFDNDPETIWHTRWTSGNDGYPHEMIVDMGEDYLMSSFTYLPRQYGTNGRVKAYELYVSNDNIEWNQPISTGEFVNSFAPSIIDFDDAIQGRYFKLVCLSEVNGNIWASAAELSLKGCYANSLSNSEILPKSIKAFPIPSSGHVSLTLPDSQNFDYFIYRADGKLIRTGKIDAIGRASYSFDLTAEDSGIYFVKLISALGISYTSKVILTK